MNKKPLVASLAIFLTIVLVVPSALLVAPRPTHAQWAVAEVGPLLPTSLKTTVESVFTAIKSALTEANTYTSALANDAQLLNMEVFQPLAFVLSGQLMKSLTAATIGFVIGKANGTGVPQFVTDVRQSMQTVSDGPALAYLKQVNLTNSPFSSSIASALNTDYLSKTSLKGFWESNMCTLAASSPNVPAYLAGNWSQGGVTAWFALTTQVQNDPYSLYQNAQSQLGNVVGPGAGGATGARASELNWGQGFGSWCGPYDASTASTAGNNPDEASATSVGVNPGDPCTNADGTPGTIKTPGSVISTTLNKVLGSQQDQIVRMGNIGPEINSILGNVATVMQTVQTATSLLGGSGSSDGLLNFSQTSSSNTASPLRQLQNSSSTLGVSNAQIYQGASTLAISGSDMTTRIAQYQSAWNTITAAANTASSSVTTLASVCTTAATAAATDLFNQQQNNAYLSVTTTPTPAELSTMHSKFIDAARAQAIAAQTALTTEIVPVFTQAAAITPTVDAATALVQKIQTELNAGADSAGSAYTTDMQTLQTIPPTVQDLVTAQQNAQVFGVAQASPAGSLTVDTTSVSSSLVDVMNLLSTNAATLQTTVCNPSSSLYVSAY